MTGGHGIPLRTAAATWARIAMLSFGGPAGQIAMMHRILVEEKRWISDRRFLHALNYCMLLPGPEAQQLAIYIGWLMHRTAGGLIAGVLFVLPGFVAIMGLSVLYAVYGNVGLVEALFFGLKAAVLAIVLQAVIRLGRRTLKNGLLVALAAGAFIGLFVYSIPFPVVIAVAALIGLVGARRRSDAFSSVGGHGTSGGHEIADRDTALGEHTPAHVRPSLRWSLSTAATFLVLWLTPVALLALALGGDSVYTGIATFFSTLAVVTFGGAYAVLAYVAQAAVETYGWLQPGEMLDGLGMAETTPGPLIMVTQFVGFMAAFRDAGGLHPLVAGALGGLLTTWVTFTPCFLWIFLGAPFAEAMHGARALNAALTAITAAVVGVILNLALWFGLHVLFAEVRQLTALGMSMTVPVPRSVLWPSVLLTAAAALAVFRWRVGVIPVLAACAVGGVLYHLAAGAIA